MGDPVDVVDITERVLPLAALMDLIGSARGQNAGAELLTRLSMYRDLSRRLRGLAPETQFVEDRILRARPIEGEIDYAELIREHMARYPRIRAALAK